jgi:phenylpyruvate tautomerase PptA (4-oxalocrotonate tautomerase family)
MMDRQKTPKIARSEIIASKITDSCSNHYGQNRGFYIVIIDD